MIDQLYQLEDLLLLGDERLYQSCEKVRKEELSLVDGWVKSLHNVMEQIRAKYNFGRGIAAPQLGIMKRLFYLNIDYPLVIINPIITYKSPELFELWDDCMSFPHLLVKVKRHNDITISYKDINWKDQELKATGDLSELIQHEYDHLDGILSIDRAIDQRSFKWKV